MMKSVNSSELRKDFGVELDNVYENKIPLIVKKKIAGGTKDFFIISDDVMLMMLKELKFNVYVTKEDSGDIILEFKELELLSYGSTMEEAVQTLIQSINVYAEDYTKNIHLYFYSPNRSNHIIYLIKIWSMAPEELHKSFNFIYES